MPKQTKTITGRASDFKFIREGAFDGKPWKLYSGFVNGEKFSTFDEAYVNCDNKEKIFLYTEKQNGKFLNKTLGQFSLAKDPNIDPFEDEIPVVEEEEKASTSGTDVEAEFVNPEEKIMKALKGDEGWLQKIYKKLVEILTVLEK